MRRLLCKIGIHDWKFAGYINYWYFTNIDGAIVNVKKGDTGSFLWSRGKKHICLRCNKYKDDSKLLQGLLDKKNKEKEQKELRKQKAHELMKNYQGE